MAKALNTRHKSQRTYSGHQARKRFGQNFLHDAAVIDRIVNSIAPKSDELLIEIGPGQGALTFPLLKQIKRLTAIELDRDLIPILQQASLPFGELTIVQADALNIDFTALANGRQIRLVGNLPYNISTPILFHALNHANVIQDMHFMLQKEVVERMGAAPGSKVFGRLSVMLQARCEVTPLFIVPPGAFIPAPKVESAIVRLVPKSPESMNAIALAHLDAVVKPAFSQRRKTLHNALRDVISDEQLLSVGVEPSARAETVAVEQWLALAQLFAHSN